MAEFGIQSTSRDVHVLQNAWLQAIVCNNTGRLMSLCSMTQKGKENLLAGMPLHYLNKGLRESVTLGHAEQVTLPGDHHITAIFSNEQIRLTVDYILTDDSPLLKIRSSIESLVKTTDDTISLCALPGLGLTADFNDLFDDPCDLYYDGAELGDGHHLPAWRVFFKAGYEQGLLLATRNKPAMGRFNFLARTIECRLVSQNNYATDLNYVHESWPLSCETAVTTEFEVGPWCAADHQAIFKEAQLAKPVRFGDSPLPAQKANSVVTSVDPLRMPIAQADNFEACSDTQFHTDRWLHVTLPGDAKDPVSGTRSILFANAGVAPDPVVFTPKLRGPHRLLVGIAHGNGMCLQQSNSSETLYREGAYNPAPFKVALRPDLPSTEIDFGVLDLKGQSLRINRFPNTNDVAMLEYIRFEPAVDQAALDASAAKSRKSRPLAGFHDGPDLLSMFNADDPDPQIVDDNIKAHAQADVRQCFWRIDGQCADYPSKHCTMRYISAKMHGVYLPQAKSYGRLLNKVDLLERAVQAGRAHDVSMWGWMRFNNYSSNVASDFFKDNPQFRDEKEHGPRANQLCLAFEEVRAHKRNILVEAAGYGLDGLCLGFLRHPPMLNYAKVMRDAYEEAYGRQPPRNLDNDDFNRHKTFPPYHDAEYRQWWQFRANYLTQFGRELKADLAQAGLGHVKVALWLRPNHCLYDGIDIDAWLDEGLCDQVISSPYHSTVAKDWPKWYWETPQWMDKVRAKVPLYRDISMTLAHAQDEVPYALRRPYDGFCLYESNMSVMDTEFLALIDQIKSHG